MRCVLISFPRVLCRVGDITVMAPGEAVASLNDFLKVIGTSIGVIILFVGIVKLIMSSMDENAKEKKDASVLFGVSIMFISMSQVLTSLGVENITGTTKPETIAANVIAVLSSLLSYAGAILAVIAVVMLVLSVSQESPEQQASGIKVLTTAIGLLSAKSLASAISVHLLAQNTSVSDYTSAAIGWLANVVTYAGGGFTMVAVFRLVMGIRSEDSKEREAAVKFFMVGIGLLTIRGVLSLFGINAV